MSKIKNKKLYEIALQTGGSHYPDVGGELLEKFAGLIIQEATNIVYSMLDDNTRTKVVVAVKEHFGVE